MQPVIQATIETYVAYSVSSAGIMLLEKQLLVNVEIESGGRSAKRARTSAATSNFTTTTWVEMSRYMCIR